MESKPKFNHSIFEISKHTDTLLYRDLTHLINMHDVKVSSDNDRVSLAYAPSENKDLIKQRLQNSLGRDWSDQVDLNELPDGFLQNPKLIETFEHEQSLLFLPYPYLVPGGRFNEMYGWDSAFGVWGVLEHNPVLARQMVDNQLYQIKHYGMVLNANRAYYLTRSQPPLISSMVMSVIVYVNAHGWNKYDPDNEYASFQSWLEYALGCLESYYNYWVSGDRFNSKTGLSRYHDSGTWPAPEVVAGEVGHYDHVKQLLLANKNDASLSALDRTVIEKSFDDNHQLTSFFYQADRSMRASGFDPSSRFGLGNLGCMLCLPVCLNSLLYKMEKDIAKIYCLVANEQRSQVWLDKASNRKAKMLDMLYDDRSHCFNDYFIEGGQQLSYDFATQLWPLWVGLFDKNNRTELDQAQRIASNVLSRLETNFGIVTSCFESGAQWDSPYGWPPLQYTTVMALENYNLKDDAKRIAQNFLYLVEKVFKKHGSLYEKYNVIEGTANIHTNLGYQTNEAECGTFLWTAGVVNLLESYRNQAQ